MTNTGKVKLIVLVVVPLFLLQLENWGGRGWFNAAICVVALYYGFYYELYRKSQTMSFELLGFTPASLEQPLVNYQLAERGKAKVTAILKAPQYPFHLIKFLVKSNMGKSKQPLTYVGFEFITQQEHYSVQLRRPNTMIAPPSSTRRQIESTEFHQYFEVYSADPKAPFYFLDPDTISDLIDLRMAFNFPINMDVAGNKIFIFINEHDGYAKAVKRFSFIEILNGKLNPNKHAAFLAATEQLLANIQKTFALLDYKLKK